MIILILISKKTIIRVTNVIISILITVKKENYTFMTSTNPTTITTILPLTINNNL